MTIFSSSEWAWILLAVVWIAAGFYRVAFASFFQPMFNLRIAAIYGGRRLQPSWWRLSVRDAGFVFVGLGVAMMLILAAYRDVASLMDAMAIRIFGIIFILFGAVAMVALGPYLGWLAKRYQRRIADRLVRGDDPYPEELRALAAYAASLQPARHQRVAFTVMILVGISYLALYSTI